MVFESGVALIESLKVFIVGLFIFVIIFAMLKKIKVFGDNDSVNSLIALVSAVIVSFTGIVTYAVSYAINWFVIIFFIIFLIIVLLLFLGVKADDIAKGISSNKKVVVIVLVLLFMGVLFKSFFGLNNAFDINEPQEDPYEVNTDFNTGVDDVTNKEFNPSFFDGESKFDKGLISVFVFLLIIGVAVIFMGK